jgi:energy-coupling factor transport system ATP-binding protein
MIHLTGIRYRALAIESLSLEPGITSFIGANGSGKTSLLKLCTGIALPEAGSVLIEGTEPRQSTIGWVSEFPDRNFLFETVSDEVASALRFRHLPPAEINRRTDEILDQFGLKHLAGRPVRELSGGEKVLVALAAAMSDSPQVIILDECDSHLDSCCTTLIDTILKRSGTPYILRSTQDMDTAAGSDTIVFLEKGRVRFSGTPETVFSALEGTPFYPMTWRCRT